MSHPASDFCPYVGLRPFTVEERAFFFGRRSETRIITANLFASPLTVFYGPSAVGKSSVLQAGVIPELRRERRTAVLYFRHWQRDDYVTQLKVECKTAIALAGGPTLTIDDTLPLDEWIEQALEQFRGQLHILLDQFEEYLLYHAEDEASAFDAELAASINRRNMGARFLLGLRDDGLAKLDRFRKRIPNLLGNTLRLQRLSAEAAREAVEGPLRVYNEREASGGPVSIEPELVDAVLAQVRADQVSTGAAVGEGNIKRHAPVDEIETAYLQLVMERLWRERAAADGQMVMRRESLDRLGGAKAIAKSHFDEHLERLAAVSPQVKDLVVDLFSHLVTPTGTKISQKEGDLIALTKVPSERVQWFLRELVSARLLRVTDPPERFEIFHDALAKPFLDCRNAIVFKRATEEQEEELKRVQAVADAQRARAEAEAKRVTEQRSAAKRFMYLAVGAVVLAIAASVTGLFAWQARNEAQLAREDAQILRDRAAKADAQTEEIRKQTAALAERLQAQNAELLAKLAATDQYSHAELEVQQAENVAANRRLIDYANTANAIKRVLELPKGGFVKGDPLTLFANAMNAFDRKQWNEAAQLFHSAADQKADDDYVQVRISGTRSEPYLPSYYLGLALKETGRCDQALLAFAQAEEQGAVQKTKQYRDLQVQRAACQTK